jgi:hypothetical protein
MQIDVAAWTQEAAKCAEEAKKSLLCGRDFEHPRGFGYAKLVEFYDKLLELVVSHKNVCDSESEALEQALETAKQAASYLEFEPMLFDTGVRLATVAVVEVTMVKLGQMKS